ncbi:ribosome biogenesis factor recycling aaa family atpase [Moniliophthora roreri]|uniref:Uncharacterized protein n=1 Tax=Moniliophthora roreri TaxID=221103 RepID=A0A0W0G648_MONRR|nr:ribosome biogenesis factor recycling aaa family atpase [Moniliophthora roreri]
MGPHLRAIIDHSAAWRKEQNDFTKEIRRRSSCVRFKDPVRGKNHWSNQRTIQLSVDEILAPYFEQKKRELNLLPMQKSLWVIDVCDTSEEEGVDDSMIMHSVVVGTRAVGV